MCEDQTINGAGTSAMGKSDPKASGGGDVKRLSSLSCPLWKTINKIVYVGCTRPQITPAWLLL